MSEQPAQAKPRKLVTIVDDDESIREFLKYAFQKLGLAVQEAADGSEALRVIRATPPDLVMLDLMMPKAGGYEVLRGLQDGESGRIPIIVMSARVLDTALMDMLRAESNVSGFVGKPIHIDQLMTVVKRLLNL